MLSVHRFVWQYFHVFEVAFIFDLDIICCASQVRNSHPTSHCVLPTDNAVRDECVCSYFRASHNRGVSYFHPFVDLAVGPNHNIRTEFRILMHCGSLVYYNPVAFDGAILLIHFILDVGILSDQEILRLTDVVPEALQLVLKELIVLRDLWENLSFNRGWLVWDALDDI